MRQPVSVLVYPAMYDNSRWKYLLLRRVPQPKLGFESFWQGVTGGLEEGETPLQAAARELSEETGFIDIELKYVDYSYSFPIRKEWRHKYALDAKDIVEHVFVAYVDLNQTPRLSKEHDEYQWCSLQEAMSLLKYPENLTGLQRCEEYLQP